MAYKLQEARGKSLLSGGFGDEAFETFVSRMEEAFKILTKKKSFGIADEDIGGPDSYFCLCDSEEIEEANWAFMVEENRGLLKVTTSYMNEEAEVNAEAESAKQPATKVSTMTTEEIVAWLIQPINTVKAEAGL